MLLADRREGDIAPNTVSVRVQTAGLPAALAAVGGCWRRRRPVPSVHYTFLDEEFAEQYVAERGFGRLFGVFAGLAIAISASVCSASRRYAAAERTKEIGVRRVLGATVAEVVLLLSKNVVVLVAAGVALAAPAVWFGMSRWLDGFAYRVEMGWLPLAMAGLLVLVIALATVGGHAVRAATADPIHALRSE